MKVSMLKNVEGKKLVEVNIFEWLEKVAPANADKEKVECITPHGTFCGGRCDKHLKKHSGLLFIDIDPEHNPHILNFSTLKPELCKLPEVLYCATSFSQKGYHLLVPITDPQDHFLHYDALKKAFKDLGIVVDPRCNNLSRLKIMSRDNDPYINKNAVAFSGKLKKEKNQLSDYSPKDIKENIELATAIVGEIEARQIDFAPEYDDYLNLAFALADGCGEEGLELFHRACQFSPKYSYDHADWQYNYILGRTFEGTDRRTFGSFLYEAKKNSLGAALDFKNIQTE